VASAKPSTTPQVRRQLPRKIILGSFLALVAIVGGSYSLALSWRETQRAQAFVPELRQWLARSPDDGRAHALLAAHLIQAKDYTGATLSLHQAILSGENTPLNWLCLAASQAAAGQSEPALITLSQGVQLHPNSMLHAARERFQAAREKSSVEQAAAILPGGPQLLLAEYGKGSFLNPLSNSTPPRGFLSRQQQQKRYPLLWADALRRNGRANEAVDLLRPMIANATDSSDSDTIEAQQLLGDALFDEKIYGKAGLAYRAVLKKKPDSLPALLGLGKVSVEKDLLTLAKESLEKVTQHSPTNVDAWIYLGRTFFSLRMRFDLSVQAFKRAAQLAPERTDFFIHYADSLRADSQFAEAEKLLRRRIREAPEDRKARFLLSMVLLEYERSPEREKEAEAVLRGILAEETRAITARTRLAQLLMETNRPEEAGPLLIDVIQADPLDAQAMRLLARAYQKIGQPEKAKRVGDEAARLAAYVEKVHHLEDQERLSPMNVAVHESLVRAYEEGHQMEKAQRQREFLVILKNNPEEARRGTALLQNATSGVMPERGAISNVDRARSQAGASSGSP
jgi:cytochrome c-type biogenesis protein CcmH/NrfG